MLNDKDLKTVSGGIVNTYRHVSHDQSVSGWKKANNFRTGVGILTLGRTISLFLF